MSNPVTFVNQYVQGCQQINSILQTLRGLNDQLTQDPTLPTRYFQSPGARTDIVAADITNAQSAVVQILFAFDSGNPTQKSFIFKLFP
jgi:hypothetical protein